MVSMPRLWQENIWGEKLKTRTRVGAFKVSYSLLRQGDCAPAAGSPGAEALYSNLQCFEGQRGDFEAGALVGCPKPDPAELPARPKRQREWTATCGARPFSERHLGHHHPQGRLSWRGLLHLHFWNVSIWIKNGTDLPHSYWWVRPLNRWALI